MKVILFCDAADLRSAGDALFLMHRVDRMDCPDDKKNDVMREKLTNAPLTRIMTADPVTVDVDAPLSRVLALMSRHGFRHIPVVQGKELLGMISQTDIMRLSFGNVFEGQIDADMTMIDLLTTGQVMVTDPHTVGPDSTVGAVARIFVGENYHALPVVENRQVIGIVSTTDVIRYFLENS